jgi:phosphoglycolate phosphatase
VGDADVVGNLRGRLIALDLDGTLVDSRRDLTDAANQLVEELGGAALSEEAVGRMIGEGAAVLVDRVLAAAGVTGRAGTLARFLDIYDSHLLDNTLPYPGVANALRAARAHGRVAVLTNKPAAAAGRILEVLGLRGLLDEVVRGDGPYPRKPAPASLFALMRGAGSTPASTLLVGDSAIDLHTARAAGSRCCIVRYGFGRVTLTSAQLSADEWSVDEASALPAVFDAFSRGVG